MELYVKADHNLFGERVKMRLFIVGTHHKHQFSHCTAFAPEEQACEAFAEYLKRQCHALGVKTLAEEMSSDARQKWQIKKTVPESVASELSINHADCDPTDHERAALGIQNEGRVKMNGLMYEQSEETVQKNIRAEYDKREQEWIRRLDQVQHEPVLFVCGADHSRSFAEKTGQRGWQAVVLEEEWTPNKSADHYDSPTADNA